jgi:hypothetical protein
MSLAPWATEKNQQEVSCNTLNMSSCFRIEKVHKSGFSNFLNQGLASLSRFGGFTGFSVEDLTCLTEISSQ